ncbi:MAG: RsmE family RNA methyltransferase [Pseudodesulfovibrio sp.]
MARRNSFYLPSPQWPDRTGETVRLGGGEARHMLTVLRSRIGDEVRLFDGHGRVGDFVIRELARSRVLLEAVRLRDHPAPAAGVTLAIGWSKSKRRKYLFEKTVELKGLGIAFWTAERSQGEMPPAPKDSWEEKCLQAAKQCGNPHLPEITLHPGGIPALIEFSRRFDRCFLAWESEAVRSPLVPADLAGSRSLVVIGPEGGLEDFEAEALTSVGFMPVTLGDSILRWETAAAYCLSLGMLARQDTQ